MRPKSPLSALRLFNRRYRVIKRKRRFFLLGICVVASLLLLGLEAVHTEKKIKIKTYIYEAASAVIFPIKQASLFIETRWQSLKNYVDIYETVDTLQLENRQLKERLAGFLSLQEDYNNMVKHMRGLTKKSSIIATAKVIAYISAPYMRSIMIPMGKKNGIKPYSPVVTSNGLVGRITELTPHTARILLINDINSRIPVIIDGVEAILLGSNENFMTLAYIQKAHPMRIGSTVKTSGKAGIFPRGIPVGTISHHKDMTTYVRPSVPINDLAFVSVLTPVKPNEI